MSIKFINLSSQLNAHLAILFFVYNILWVKDVLFFQINLIAPPLYVVTTQTLERTDGLEALNKAIVAIKASIEDAGGMFNIQLQVLVNNTTCTTQNGAIDAVKT